MPKNVSAALNYNEKKVQKGTAECLYAANYLSDAKDMNFYQKLNGLENVNCLNKRATTKILHVSLNFVPMEKLQNKKLEEIACKYMEKIGFGNQPFLVDKHNEAGHPHIYIVSTTIKEDGSRIDIDFSVEPPINFVTVIIWFLRTYADGKYCTLLHVAELMQTNYDELFPLFNIQPEIEVLVNPFIRAFQNDAMEQLKGQAASAKIGMTCLPSSQLYWMLSENDFTLGINNPIHPKIVCVGNNPEK